MRHVRTTIVVAAFCVTLAGCGAKVKLGPLGVGASSDLDKPVGFSVSIDDKPALEVGVSSEQVILLVKSLWDKVF